MFLLCLILSAAHVNWAPVGQLCLWSRSTNACEVDPHVPPSPTRCLWSQSTSACGVNPLVWLVPPQCGTRAGPSWAPNVCEINPPYGPLSSWSVLLSYSGPTMFVELILMRVKSIHTCLQVPLDVCGVNPLVRVGSIPSCGLDCPNVALVLDPSWPVQLRTTWTHL